MDFLFVREIHGVESQIDRIHNQLKRQISTSSKRRFLRALALRLRERDALTEKLVAVMITFPSAI